jgi:uncharacterized protein YndB with AHSA1/START domain
MASISDSVDIAASPEAVFEAVSHLEKMGQFSPENTGGTWLKGATGPSLGAQFRGTNQSGKKSWTTGVKVVTYDKPHAFAFEVTAGPAKVALWSYEITATDSGSRVSETWLDRRGKVGAMFSKFIRTDREEFTRTSIRTTLENLKAHLEA